MTSNLPQREAVARIIDPVPFENWQTLFDTCMDEMGEDEARNYADFSFGASKAALLSKADQIISSLQDRAGDHVGDANEMVVPEGWRDHVTDTVHQVAKRTSEEGYSVAIMREGIEAIISSLKGSDVGEVGECSMCFGKLKPEEDGGRDCESCGAVWVEGT